MAFDDYKAAMFSTKWKTSARTYNYVVERGVKIPMPDGVRLDCDIWRPGTDWTRPAVIS